jgi:branched-chain amino acid transport system substrate-binding protein
MTMARSVIRAAAAIVSAALLFTGQSTARAADSIEIPAIVPLTGQGSFIGKAYQTALMALESSVNKAGGIQGRSLKFVLLDDASNPSNTLQLFNGLVAKNANVVLGAPLTAECNAMVPMVKDGPLLYCLTPAVYAPAGSYVFSADPSTIDKTVVSIHYFVQRGITRFGVLTSIDATGQDADRAIAAAMSAPQNKGAEDVVHEHFAVTDLSVTAQLERIKAAKPQVLLGWATGTPFGTILRGARDVGLDIPVWTTSGNLTYGQMAQYKDILPKELLFPAVAAVAPDGVSDREVQAAVASFRQAMRDVGARPEYIASVAYDPALLIVTALRKLGPRATAAQLRAYLSATTSWAGAEGRYNFRAVPQRGLGPDSIFVVRWDQQKDDWIAVSTPRGSRR